MPPELDPETKAWLEEEARRAERERAELFANMERAAQAPGVVRPGPNETPLENWQQMYGNPGQADDQGPEQAPKR